MCMRKEGGLEGERARWRQDGEKKERKGGEGSVNTCFTVLIAGTS